MFKFLYPAGCGRPSSPVNGSLVQFVSAEVHAVITYKCSAGFIPRSPQVSVCTENRTWTPDPTQLVCQELPTGDCVCRNYFNPERINYMSWLPQ